MKFSSDLVIFDLESSCKTFGKNEIEESKDCYGEKNKSILSSFGIYYDWLTILTFPVGVQRKNQSIFMSRYTMRAITRLGVNRRKKILSLFINPGNTLGVPRIRPLTPISATGLLSIILSFW